jgi:hypothetical protein
LAPAVWPGSAAERNYQRVAGQDTAT